MQVVAQHAQHRRLGADFLHLGVKRRRCHLQKHEFVDQQLRHQGSGDAVVGGAALLPGLHGLGVSVPEVVRQGEDPRVQDVGVLQHLVVRVVLGRQAERARLHAHVDVLGHQHHVAVGARLAQRAHDPEDVVVGLPDRQAGRQNLRDRLRLQKQAAGGLGVADRGQQNPLLDLVVAGRHQCIERAARLPGVARHLRQAFLVAVQLLQRHHRQEDVVLLEAKQARGVVHQHVGVEHEQLGSAARRTHLATGSASARFDQRQVGCRALARARLRCGLARPSAQLGCGLARLRAERFGGQARRSAQSGGGLARRSARPGGGLARRSAQRGAGAARARRRRRGRRVGRQQDRGGLVGRFG